MKKSPNANSGQIFDRDAALSFVGHDQDFLCDLVETFREYYPKMLDRIRKAIEMNDTSEVREAAHQLKGALGNFHACAAADTAYELELKGRDFQLDAAALLHDDLTDDLNVLYESLVGLLNEISSDPQEGNDTK